MIKRNRTEYSKERYSSNPDKFKEIEKVSRRTRNGIVNTIYQTQKRNSKKRDHSLPDYSLFELRKWIFSQPNFEKLYSDWVDSNYDKYMKPSIDRIDDYIGYSFENIRLVTWRENDEKGSRDIINGVNKKKFKRVIMDGERMFESIKEASLYLGDVSKNSNITNCCLGKRNSAYGHKWEYYD